MYMNMLQINEPIKDIGPLLALTNNPSNKEMSVMAKSNIAKSARTCQVEGCHEKHYGNGYCSRHYYEHRRHGEISSNPTRSQKDPNDFILKGDMCEITLFDREGFMTGKAIIDAEDYEKVIGFKWHMIRKPSGQNYVISAARMKPKVYLHRLVLSSSTTVDHINGNGLDNRKCNLRECTASENVCNTGPSRRNLKGVYADGKRWRARIMKNGVRYNIGSFSSPTDAAIAYNNAAKDHHGEFAFFNNVPSWPEV